MPLSIALIMNQKIKVRVNFVAVVLLLIAIPLTIGGIYTLGVVIPMVSVAIYCLYSKRVDFVGLIPIRIYRLMYVACLIVGGLIYVIQGGGVAISWLISAIVIALAEPYVRFVLSLGGLLNLLN